MDKLSCDFTWIYRHYSQSACLFRLLHRGRVWLGCRPISAMLLLSMHVIHLNFILFPAFLMTFSLLFLWIYTSTKNPKYYQDTPKEPVLLFLTRKERKKNKNILSNHWYVRDLLRTNNITDFCVRWNMVGNLTSNFNFRNYRHGQFLQFKITDFLCNYKLLVVQWD